MRHCATIMHKRSFTMIYVQSKKEIKYLLDANQLEQTRIHITTMDTCKTLCKPVIIA